MPRKRTLRRARAGTDARALIEAAARAGVEPLDDGSVVFITHDAGELGVDTPIVVRAAIGRFEVSVETRRGKQLIAYATNPDVALLFGEERVRFLDLEIPMRWESGCSVCHRRARAALRASGDGAEVSFDEDGFLASKRSATRMWFARRGDGHVFAEERTPPNCPSEVAGADIVPDDHPEEHEISYRTHRRGVLLRTEAAGWLWHSALDVRSAVATGVARLERGEPARDTFAHLPPPFADRYDLAFGRRYLAAVDDVCERLLARREPLPGCVAQEIALGTMLDHAEASVRQFRPGDDMEDLREILHEDLDYELLYGRGGLATIANENVQSQLRPAYLGFHEWFKPFRDEALPLAVITSKAPPPPRVKRLLSRARRELPVAAS